jgi:predicted nucleic acid-binding protein
MRQIVSDTGPLISLEKLSQGYEFIRRLYDKLLIAPAVLEEVAAGQFATPEEYLQHYGISDLIEVRTVSQPHELPEAERLQEGETQAIQLALELQLPLLIEETIGRRVTQSIGIQISGIAGQIIKAFRQDFIVATEAQNKLSELLRGGRINRKIYEALLASLSEV